MVAYLAKTYPRTNPHIPGTDDPYLHILLLPKVVMLSDGRHTL
jgi:hypothetical protein